MKTITSSTIAFTGHREFKSGISADNLAETLDKVLTSAIAEGYTTFVSGMAQGFDLLAAEAVLRLKKINTNVRLTCAIPFKGQDARYSPEDKIRYKNITDSSDEMVYTSQNYYEGCFLHRNDYMLSVSSMLIAYFDNSQKSGTGYTVRRAQRNNQPVINLY